MGPDRLDGPDLHRTGRSTCPSASIACRQVLHVLMHTGAATELCNRSNLLLVPAGMMSHNVTFTGHCLLAGHANVKLPESSEGSLLCQVQLNSYSSLLHPARVGRLRTQPSEACTGGAACKSSHHAVGVARQATFVPALQCWLCPGSCTRHTSAHATTTRFWQELCHVCCRVLSRQRGLCYASLFSETPPPCRLVQ